jgi:hypothetical protein
MGIELMTGEHYTIAGDTIVPDSNYAGTLVVGVRVDDGTDTSDPFDFTLTVTPVNDAPVMGEVSSPVTVVAGEELTVAFTAEDPDDSILVVEGIDLPSTAMIVDGEADTAVLFWVPEKADTGTYNLVVTVTDGDLVDSVSLVIEVLTTAPKTPPRIASLPADTIAVADSLFTVMLSATDDDDSVVVFSMEGLPAEAELIEEGPMTATLRWTPGRADTGSYTVGIVAVGEDNLGDTASFELLVVSADTLVPVENAPQLDTASAIQANDTITLAGEPLSDTILFSDPDGDPVHLSLVAAPEGMTIDSLTGHLLWDPGDTAADTVVTVTVEATDTAGLSVSISFYVAVDVEEVEPWVLIRAHRNPVVTKIVDVFVKTSPNIGKVTGEIVIGGSTKTLSFTAVSGRRDVYHARNDGPTGGSCTVRVIAEMSDGTKKTYSRKGSF